MSGKILVPSSEEQARAAAALDRIRRLGNLLDSSIPVPGTDFKIGIDPLIGFFPVVGDVIGALLSSYIVFESWRLQVPRRALGRMLWNIAVELAAGFVPVLGDVFDSATRRTCATRASPRRRSSASTSRPRTSSARCRSGVGPSRC